MSRLSEVDYVQEQEQRNAAPMPWIGLYIALASLICFLAMAADTCYGFRSRRLWFPCRFFSLNAASLALLAVAGKLTVDLNTVTWGIQDQIVKLSSLVLMTTALGNFITSLGSMDNQAILANLSALGIFIITVIVNISLQISLSVVGFASFQLASPEYIFVMILLVFLFLLLVSSSVFVPTTKKYIETKYREKEQLALNVEKPEEIGNSMSLKLLVKRYWVMAATGNPQFVMARSAIYAISGSLSLLCALTLVESEIRLNKHFKKFAYADFLSDYKWSTIVILFAQFLGVAVGIVPPTLRLFIAVSSKFSEIGSKSLKDELKIETYWTQRLEDWRESSLPFYIHRSIKCRKLVHNTKYSILSFCIKVQVLIVVSSKLLLLLHGFFLTPFLLLLNHVSQKQESQFFTPTNQSGQQSEPGHEFDLNEYVLLLEGETRLPEKILRNIFSEVDRLILEGKKRKPKALVELLQGACSFNSVADFEDDQIPSSYSQEPPICWILPIVTLTTIALSLKNIDSCDSNQLLRSVREGLPYVKLIQKYQDTSRTVEHIQNAGESLWVGVELYRNWLDMDLSNLDGNTSEEVLRGFMKTAEKITMEFKMKMNEQMENPIYWPVKVIAANSMYRISKTILFNIEGDEQIFKKLSVTIADIFASCFTNLSRIITLKCQCDAIEERERSVGEAAILLGETENILEIVQQRKLSGIVPDQVACIDDWRVSIKNRNTIPSSSPEEAVS